MVRRGSQVQLLSPNNLFAIPSGELNSALISLLLSLVFFLRCSIYKYEFREISYSNGEKNNAMIAAQEFQSPLQMRLY
jgi:hypothetical protein